jgi:hypothetical protein
MFSLEALHDFLKHGDLLPSHRILKDDLDAHFSALAARGIRNVQQIVDTLTTKNAIERFAGKTRIPPDYLTILRRHVRGYIPAPVNFADIPDIDPQVVERLAKAGVGHTKHLFERAHRRAERHMLAQQIGLTEAEMLQLIQFTDLARMGWVGPIGVRLFHAAGATSVETLATLDLDAFHERVLAVNQERQYMKVKLARKDIALCRDMAKKLPRVIEY